MFTGIVETTAAVVDRAKDRLVLAPRLPLKGLALGESVSIDGVCLTIDQLLGTASSRKVVFRLLPETVRVSTLGSLRPNDQVNLERSLRMGDRLGGHLLLGHVDGQGTVAARSQTGSFQTLELRIPSPLISYLVPKGPIGVDGVSLTLDASLPRNGKGSIPTVRVHLIPHTAKATTLGGKPVGAKVNIEVDLVAKYLLGML